MVLDMDCRVVSEPGILAADVGGDIVLMDAVSGKYFTFEGVGGDIWRELVEPVSVAALCEHLVQEYDAPADRVRASTLEFLDDVLRRGLIKVV